MDSRAAAYRLFAKITIATVYALILVGGIVRSTGSGLGCPDWPRCFGRWVPPTQESQLPPDYKTRYAKGRLTPELVVFNPVNTWVEYLNRLLGALTGLFIFAAVVLAFRGHGNSATAWLTFGGFVLTGVQGWLGAKVVDTALMPLIITLHNLLAQVIVYLLLAGYWLSRRGRQEAVLSRQEKNWALVGLGLVIIQFYLGLGVRQFVDTYTQAGAGKDAVMADFVRGGHTYLFLIHRSFSWLVAGFIGWQAWRYFKAHRDGFDEGTALQQLALLGVGGNIVVGLCLQGLDLPAWGQPLHLLLGSVVLGVFFSLWMLGMLSPRSL